MLTGIPETSSEGLTDGLIRVSHPETFHRYALNI